MNIETMARAEQVKRATRMANRRFKSVWHMLAEAHETGRAIEAYIFLETLDDCSWQEKRHNNSTVLLELFAMGLLRIKPLKTKTYQGHVIVDITTDRIVSGYAFDAAKNRPTLTPNQVLATLSYGPVDVVGYDEDGLPV